MEEVIPAIGKKISLKEKANAFMTMAVNMKGAGWPVCSRVKGGMYTVTAMYMRGNLKMEREVGWANMW